jgi:hypothetical protein
MERLYIVLAASFVFFLIFLKGYHRELRTMRDQISKLKVSVLELEHDYNRRLILSLNCPEHREEAPLKAALADQAPIANPPLAEDKGRAPSDSALVIAAVH